MKKDLSIPWVVAITIGSVIVSYFTAQISTNERIGALDTKVQVAEAKSEGIDDRLERIETKVDALLQRTGATEAQIQLLNQKATQ